MAGYVYFAVFATRPNEVKIGWTSDLWHRNRKLKYEAKCEPAFLGVQSGNKELETSLHQMFRHHRSGGTDWFYLHGDIWQYISVNASPYQHPRRLKKQKPVREPKPKADVKWAYISIDEHVLEVLKFLKEGLKMKSYSDVIAYLLQTQHPEITEHASQPQALATPAPAVEAA